MDLIARFYQSPHQVPPKPTSQQISDFIQKYNAEKQKNWPSTLPVFSNRQTTTIPTTSIALPNTNSHSLELSALHKNFSIITTTLSPYNTSKITITKETTKQIEHNLHNSASLQGLSPFTIPLLFILTIFERK